MIKKIEGESEAKELVEMITYKFRFYPNKSQARVLLRWMGACRFVYNCALEQRIDAYKKTGKTLSYIDQQNELPECKKMVGFEWLSEVPSQSLQMSLRNLDRAYKNFFRRVKNSEVPGFPKKKKKGRSIDSITFPQAGKVSIGKITNKKSILLGLPKLKGGLKIFQHRKVEGKIKIATITCRSGEWYVSLTCEKVASDYLVHAGDLDAARAIGVDLGITKTIATTKEDHTIDLEKIKKLEKQISTLQRRVAKKEKFSDPWKKVQKIIAKKHSKIARIRKDFLHKKSYELCKKHAIVCMENLKVKNMSKSASGTIEAPGSMVAQKSGLNRSILRQGWGMFREMCEYKARRYGGTLVLVNPKNTSRKCSSCGHTEGSNRKTQDHFSCQKCSHEENADRNAAKNILALGLESLGLSALEAPAISAKAV